MSARRGGAPLGDCRFTAEGLNLERFVNELARNGVALREARRLGGRALRCRCRMRDMPRVRALAEEKGWRLSGEEALGLARAARFFRRRWGVPLGAALALVLVAFAWQFVWRVEVSGAGAYRGDVEGYLLEQGVGVGRGKRGVDARALERGLYRRYPELTWFTVYVHGVTLRVECARGALPGAPDARGTGDLYAQRDGIIQEIQVYAGTARVRPGDAVRAGQVLIEGAERAADETTTPVRAEGRVLARCWLTRRVALPTTEIISVPTGRQTERLALVTPWGCVPAEEDAPDYLTFDREVTLTPLVGALLPITVRRTVYREAALHRAPRDEAEVRAEGVRAAEALVQQAARGKETVDKWADFSMIKDGLLAVSVTAELLVDIGGPEPPRSEAILFDPTTPNDPDAG